MPIGVKDGDLTTIHETPLFNGIDETTFDVILDDAVVHELTRGETVFLQGDKADAFYVVLDGWIKLFRLTPAGEEAIVNVFTRGQSFAEAAAFTGGRFPVSSEAVTDCRLLYIPVTRLFEKIKDAPEVGLALLASTSRHLHVLVQQIEQLKAHTGAQRVAEFLVELCPPADGKCTIVLPYDKALIAGRLGMKPESLSRAFQRLRDYGVKVASNKAEITDVTQLRRLVDEERAIVLQRHHQRPL